MTVCDKCRKPLATPDINLLLEQDQSDHPKPEFVVVAELCLPCNKALHKWLTETEKK